MQNPSNTHSSKILVKSHTLTQTSNTTHTDVKSSDGIAPCGMMKVLLN